LVIFLLMPEESRNLPRSNAEIGWCFAESATFFLDGIPADYVMAHQVMFEAGSKLA
jgi:hypothetical protein